MDALVDRSRCVPNAKNRIDSETEQVAVAYAIEEPTYGQVPYPMNCVNAACLSRPVEYEVSGAASNSA